jgi:hypothetical protein
VLVAQEGSTAGEKAELFMPTPEAVVERVISESGQSYLTGLWWQAAAVALAVQLEAMALPVVER